MKKIKNHKKNAMIETENVLLILAAIVVLFVVVGAVYTGVNAIMTTTKVNNITKQQNTLQTDYTDANPTNTVTPVTAQ